MGRKRITKLNAGYTFFEVLVSSILLLIVVASFAGAYTVFYRGQVRSKALMSDSYTLLKAALYVREKTAELKIPYWENPLPKVKAFTDFILTTQPVPGVVFTKTDCLFDEEKHLCAVEFYYTLDGNSDEYGIKCLLPVITPLSVKGE